MIVRLCVKPAALYLIGDQCESPLHLLGQLNQSRINRREVTGVSQFYFIEAGIETHKVTGMARFHFIKPSVGRIQASRDTIHTLLQLSDKLEYSRYGRLSRSFLRILKALSGVVVAHNCFLHRSTLDVNTILIFFGSACLNQGR
jgi:hypothetical protein